MKRLDRRLFMAQVAIPSPLFALLASCGGGQGGPDTASPRLSSLTFAPHPTAVAPGSNLYLRVHAGFNDGTSMEVTSAARWQSTDTAIASVGASTGIVRGVATGTATISASYEGLTASLPLRVGSHLQAIEIFAPQLLAIGIDAEYPLTAIGHFTDRSTAISELVNWISSNPEVASVSNEAGRRGLVRGTAPGFATLTAALDGVTQSLRLEVLAVRSLDSGTGRVPPGSVAIGVDAAGRTLALWSYPFPTAGFPDLVWSARSPAADWNGRNLLRPALPDTRTARTRLAMNANGLALAAWLQFDGLHAASYRPARDWQPETRISEFPIVGTVQPVALAIDGDGNGLLTWLNAAPASGFSSASFSPFDDRWSAPVEIPGSFTPGYQNSVGQTVMNAAGQAVMVWVRQALPGPGLIDYRARILASRFVPGTGWLAPETVFAPNILPTVAVGINDLGDILVSWIDTPSGATTDGSIKQLRSRVFKATSGWQEADTVGPPTTRQPSELKLAISKSSAAVLAWSNLYDNSIEAAILDRTGSWSTPRTLGIPVIASQAGTPQLLQPFTTDDGRVLVSWVADDLQLAPNGVYVSARFLPPSGWEAAKLDRFLARRAQAHEIALAFNRDGKGAVLWVEGTADTFDCYVNTSLTF